MSRGDVAGASFGFRTVKDRWFDDGGTIVRELLDVEITEISLTAFAAYPQTDVAVAQRSLQAWQAMGPIGPRRSVAWLRRALAVR